MLSTKDRGGCRKFLEGEKSKYRSTCGDIVMCSVWGNGDNDLCGSGGLLLGSGRRLASRSSLYSFECAPLAEAQWERASQ